LDGAAGGAGGWEMSDELMPCLYCGAGETHVQERRLSPTMEGPGALVSVVIYHHCEPLKAHTAMREIRARDHTSAVAEYNRRLP
jgi:hypothetical protein